MPNTKTVKAAEFAVLRAALEMNGCEGAYVTIVGAASPSYRVSVMTRKAKQRLFLSAQSGPPSPREFKTLNAAVQSAFALTGLNRIVIER